MSDRTMIMRKVEQAKGKYLDAKKILDRHDELEGDRLELGDAGMASKAFQKDPFIDDKGNPQEGEQGFALVIATKDSIDQGAEIPPDDAIRFRDFLTKWLKRHGYEAS